MLSATSLDTLVNTVLSGTISSFLQVARVPVDGNPSLIQVLSFCVENHSSHMCFYKRHPII